MANKNIAWVLVDHRAGNSNQGKALASLLDLDYTVKHLEYNLISSLPNFIKYGFLELTKKSKEELLKAPQAPSLVISSGRRMASVAVAVKNKYPNCKLLQIMHPGLSLKHFETIILPEHDKKPQSKYLNKTVFITGALSYYPADKTKEDIKKWQAKLGTKKFPKPVISLLIGGKSKGCGLTVGFITSLLETLAKVSNRLGASVFISTSRRTPLDVSNFLKENLANYIKRPHYLYDPFYSKDENPYRGFLALADYIIVTGDSISMCSEAANTMKPTYIAYDGSLISEKHLRFVNSMFSSNHARPFTEELESFFPNAESNSEALKHNILDMIKFNG